MPPIILILSFLAVYQLTTRFKISPVTGASFAALIPLITSIFIHLIHTGGNTSGLIRWIDVVMVIVQFIAYLFVLYRAEHEDSIVSWMMWGLGGLTVVLFANQLLPQVM